MKPFTILLVEDNPDHAELQAEILLDGNDNIRVQHAADGRSALRYLEAAKTNAEDWPELILLDVNMPGLDGFEVLSHLKSDGDLLSIPTVIFTTSRSREEVARAMALHANSFASKSDSFDQMERCLLTIRTYWMDVHAR